MRRPIGIAILAVLSFVVGAFYLIAAIGFLASAPWTASASLQTGFTPRYGWLFLLIGIVDLSAGYGLWKLRRWGWSLMVVLVLINLGIAVGTIFAGVPLAGPIISLAVNGFVLWYLFRPGVKAAFLAAEATRVELHRVA